MSLLRQSVAAINIVSTLAFTLTAVGLHPPALEKVNEQVGIILFMGIGVTSFAGGFHLLQNNSLYRRFLLASGILWLVLAVILAFASVGSPIFPIGVSFMGNINLAFLGFDSRTRRR